MATSLMAEPSVITAGASGAPADANKESKELFFRRKEKEIAKREEQLKQATDEVNAAREAVDSLLQELEARELVMNEAEAKHGSLIEREEAAAKRESEQLERSRALEAEQELLQRQRAECEALEKTRKRDYEDKLFPLAAREQEIIRRESEVHSLEIELDSKMRAFSRKMQQEDERDRQKEKAFKEQETKLKEFAAQVDKKYAEAEGMMSLNQEKLKTIKAEQVELESRDRDVKWKDDQLRTAHQEAHETKSRLMRWERTLSVREEELNVLSAELQLQKTTLDSKELELGERMNRVLAAEKEVQVVKNETAEKASRVDALEAAANERLRETKEREAKISDDVHASKERLQQAEELSAEAKARESKAVRLLREVEERERALKNWIVELDYKEQELLSTRQLLVQAATTNAPAHNVVDSAAASSAHGTVTHPSPEFSLRKLQDLYIGATAHNSQRIAALRDGLDRKTQRRRSLTTAAGAVDHLPAPAPPAELTDELATIAELEREITKMADRFGTCMARYYCIPRDRMDRIFTRAESEKLTQMLDAEARFHDEDTFLASFIGETHGGGGASPLESYTTLAQWQQLFHRVSWMAVQRRRDLLSTRLGRLATWNDIFATKEANCPDFPKDPRSILGVGEPGTSGIMQRIHRRLPKPTAHERRERRRGTSPKETSSPAPTQSQSDAKPAGEGRPEKAKAAERSDGPAAAKGPMKIPTTLSSVAAQAELRKVIETLPSYLRRYYDEEA